MWNMISVTTFNNYKYIVHLHNFSACAWSHAIRHAQKKAQAENQSLTLLQNHKEERGKNRPRVLGK